MKYAGMPRFMWRLYRGSFRRRLTDALGYDADESARIVKAAKPEYQRIIAGLPEFEKGDRFKLNLVNCALFAAVLLHLPKKPDVEAAAEYYRRAMMIAPTRAFCRVGGRLKFTDRAVAGMKAAAALRAADRNPYSWNMDYLPYPDGSGYEARFTHCGICTLMKELGLYELTPAMCKLDYAMSEAGGASTFVREYTLASGGPYCDCGYVKKGRGAK